MERKAVIIFLCSLVLWVGFVASVGQPDGGEVKRLLVANTDLEVVVQQLTTQMTQMQARLNALTNSHISFLAKFSQSSLSLPIYDIPFRFDMVQHNDGHAYDGSTGVFTAPTAGAYLFTVQLFTEIRERPMFDLRLNGTTVLSRSAFDTTSGSAEQSDVTSMVVKLRPGDRVTVQNGYGTEKNFEVWGLHHSYFSGALLYPDN